MLIHNVHPVALYKLAHTCLVLCYKGDSAGAKKATRQDKLSLETTLLNVAYKITTMLNSRVTGVRWALAGEKYIQIQKSFPVGIDRFCVTFFGLSFPYL